MPTIPELPPASSVSPSDIVPISQGGSVHAASIGALLLAAQPVITVQSPSLLGRTSLGSGGPEQIDVGLGMSLVAGTVVANGADHATYPSTSSLDLGSDLVISNQGSQMLMPTELLRGLFSAGPNVTIDANGIISTTGGSSLSLSGQPGMAIGALKVVSSVTAQDLLPLSRAGTEYAIAYSGLLDGLTIDQAPSAGAAADSDTLWVAQATNVMSSQSFGAIWLWIATKLLSYKFPVVEVATSTSLAAAVHNGRILVCSQPVTLTPVASNMGSGFQCQVVNVSNGSVTLGSGFLTSSGNSTLGPQQSVTIQCLTYSEGTVVYASMPSPSVAVVAPGQVIQLTASNLSNTSVTLAWQQPTTGGLPSTYSVQYRQTGSTTWSTGAASVATTSFQLTGLQTSTSYDFVVVASNVAGTGTASQVLTVSTAAGQAQLPNQVIGLTAVATSSSTVQLSWTGQSGAGAAVTYTVQYSAAGSVGWTSSVPGIATTSFSVTGLQPATSYSFSVLGVNAAGTGAASAVVSSTTSAVGNAVSLITWNVGPSGTYVHSNGAIGLNVHVSPSSAAVQFGFSTSSTTPPASWVAGLLVNTDLWGAYVPTPSTAGSWYAWAEGTDGSSPTVFSTPFVVQ